MITIKEFDKGLKLNGVQYEVGKTYTAPFETEDSHVTEFRAVADGDIGYTIHDRFFIDVEYALVVL